LAHEVAAVQSLLTELVDVWPLLLTEMQKPENGKAF
jgi:hypothetical protein